MARINNERSLKDYGELTEIGRGGFGVVYSATRLSDGQKVAIKKISGKVAPERLRNELRAIRSMRHPNIVAFYEDFVENGETCVVMELCPDGSIRDYVRKNGELSKATAVYILRQLISAVKYIHHENMLHRDLSSGNILIKNIFSKEKIKVKLCDFGLATQLRHGETACTVVGTPGFIAPQVFGQKYDRAADVFSLGGVLYTMLTGRDPPQQGRPRLHGLDDDAADLIDRMMHPDSKQRIELADIQNSDFVRNTGDSGLSRDWSVDRRSSADPRFSLDRRRRGESRERAGVGGGGDRWSGQVSRDFSRGTSWTRDRDRGEKRFSMDRAASGSTARQRRAQSQPPREMDYERRAGGERRGGESGEDRGASSVRGRSVRERRGDGARGGGGEGEDMPWPLRLERIHGNTMVNAHGRFLMMSDRAAKFEMTHARSRCVDRVLHVITDGGERQKVMISRPMSELRPRAQTDPPIPNDVLAVGDTCISASQLSAVDAAAYRRLAHAVAWFRARTAKIAWNRPPQFPSATAKLFENGDVRVTFFDTRTLVQKAGQSEVTGGEKNNRVAVTGETLARFSDLVRCLRHHADCPGTWTAYPITISSAREGGAGGAGSPQVLASRQSAASSMLTQRSAPSVLATRQNSLRTTSSGYASGEGREMERRDERSSRSRDKENRGVVGKVGYSLRKNAAGQVCSVTSQSDGTMMRRSGSYPGIYIYVSGGKETRFRYNGAADSKKVPEAGRHLLEVLLEEIGES